MSETNSFVPPIDAVRNDFSTSRWLRNALETALQRDPIDAVNDAELLAQLLRRRCDEILQAARAGF